jgi:hypothetical protein
MVRACVDLDKPGYRSRPQLVEVDLTAQRVNLTVRVSVCVVPAPETVTVSLAETRLRALSARPAALRMARGSEILTCFLAPAAIVAVARWSLKVLAFVRPTFGILTDPRTTAEHADAHETLSLMVVDAILCLVLPESAAFSAGAADPPTGGGGGVLFTGGGVLFTGGGVLFTGGGVLSAGGGVLSAGGGVVTGGGGLTRRTNREIPLRPSVAARPTAFAGTGASASRSMPVALATTPLRSAASIGFEPSAT